jgi:hypothetical protein
VRSAKQTTLDIIGRPLDEQLRLEALNGYAVGAVDDDRLRRSVSGDDADAGGFDAVWATFLAITHRLSSCSRRRPLVMWSRPRIRRSEGGSSGSLTGG